MNYQWQVSTHNMQLCRFAHLSQLQGKNLTCVISGITHLLLIQIYMLYTVKVHPCSIDHHRYSKLMYRLESENA